VRVKSIWGILKNAFTGFSQHNVLRLSAALAYYAMFSIGPLLILAVGIAGLAFNSQTVHDKMHDQLIKMVGPSSTKTIESMMVKQTKGPSIVATVIGLGALLFGAGGVFGGLQDALNTIWGVKARPNAGLKGLIRSRFLSLGMVLGTGFLLLVSMALSTFLSAVTDTLGGYFFSSVLVNALNFIVSFAVIAGLFAMIFKYLPDVNIPFRDVWVGAAGTALLFTIGKSLLGLYLGRSATSSPYGAAGSVIIVLLWVYYASVILFFGAEFTRAFVLTVEKQVTIRHFAMPASKEKPPGTPIPAGSPQAPENKPRPHALPAVPSPALTAFETSKKAHRGAAAAPIALVRPAKLVGWMALAGFISGLAYFGKSGRRRSH
jgi:membrane protein